MGRQGRGAREDQDGLEEEVNLIHDAGCEGLASQRGSAHGDVACGTAFQLPDCVGIERPSRVRVLETAFVVVE